MSMELDEHGNFYQHPINEEMWVPAAFSTEEEDTDSDPLYSIDSHGNIELVRTGDAYPFFDQSDYDVVDISIKPEAVPYETYNVYLAGAMTGLSKAQAQGWRNSFKEQLPKGLNVKVFDPTDKLNGLLPDAAIIENSYPESPTLTAEEVFRQDMEDLLDSHFVVIYHPGLCEGANSGWGTAFEAGVAYMSGAVVIHIFYGGEHAQYVQGQKAKHPLKVGFYVGNVVDAAKLVIDGISGWNHHTGYVPEVGQTGDEDSSGADTGGEITEAEFNF